MGSLLERSGHQVVKKGEAILLLDASSSMDLPLADGRTCWEALLEAIEPCKGCETFSFNDRLFPGIASEPDGGTDLTGALQGMPKGRIVLVTDGQPNDPFTALQAAKGRHIDVVYIGPEPMPDFLRVLVKQCSGSLSKGKIEETKALGEQLKALTAGGERVYEA